MASSKNEVLKKPIPKLKSQLGVWLLNNISWLAPTIVAMYLGWVQFYQYVEADLTVTSVNVETDTPTERVYAIDFIINNSGNKAVILVNAFPYIRHISDANKPPLLLRPTNSPETFKDNSIEAGKMKSFSAHAHINKSFIYVGMDEAKKYYRSSAKQKHMDMPIEVGVRIYGADGKFRSATSIPIKIGYSEGRQINFKVKSESVPFRKVDKEDWITWDFKESIQ